MPNKTRYNIGDIVLVVVLKIKWKILDNSITIPMVIQDIETCCYDKKYTLYTVEPTIGSGMMVIRESDIIGEYKP
jgi:hypothetical protein